MPPQTRVIAQVNGWMDEDGTGQDQAMLGAAAPALRIGYFAVAVLLGRLQGLCGFRGAALPVTYMDPHARRWRRRWPLS